MHRSFLIPESAQLPVTAGFGTRPATSPPLP